MPLTSINDLLELIKKNYPQAETYSLVSRIAIHHRIQGSRGLWEAVKEVKEFLDYYGIETRIYRIDNGDELGLVKAPVGWDLVYGEVIVRDNGGVIAKLDTIRHPTLVAAHSPGGSGSGKIVFGGIDKLCGDGDVLVTSDSLAAIYGTAVENGFKAVAWYSPSRSPHGTPYTGLFHTPEEASKASVPVFTLPYSLVSKIMARSIGSTELSIEWNIDVEYHGEGLPVLEAVIGEGEYSVVGVAHICHPKPGAHDNASGSAALAGVAVALSRIYGELDPGVRLNLYWVPEYTGSIALFKQGVISRERVAGVLNLDMVGSRQDATHSTLHLIRSMVGYMGALTPLAKLAVELVYMSSRTFHGQPAIGRIVFDETPYGNGSDHDVFLVNRVEGVMFNEWPSTYYHTDLDVPDTIGYRELYMIGSAAALALSVMARPDVVGNVVDYIKNYYGNLITWYAMESVKRGFNRSFVESRVSKLISYSMRRALSWVKGKNVLYMEDLCCTDYPLYTGVSHVSIRRYTLERGLDLYRVLRDNKVLGMLVSTYYPAYASGLYSTRDIVELFIAEELVDPGKIVCYGVKGVECMEKLLDHVGEWLVEKRLLKKG